MTITAFSFAGTKLPSYITTCYPGAALLIAGFVYDWQLGQSVLSRRLSLLASAVILATAFGVSVAIVTVAIYFEMHSLIVCAVAPLSMIWPAWRLYRQPDQLELTSSAGKFRRLWQAQPVHAFAFACVALIGALLGLGPAIVTGYRSDLDQIVAAGKAVDASLPDGESNWLTIGTLEPSWVFYLQHPIKEVARIEADALSKSGWYFAAIDHLSEPNARLITTRQDAELIEQRWSSEDRVRSDGLSLARIAELQRFLEDEHLVVLRAVPADASTRIAAVPHSGTASNTAEPLQR